MRNFLLSLTGCLLLAAGLPTAAMAGDGNVTAQDLVEYCGVTEVDAESHTAIA